ncbi:hypothetical protein ABBQ32_010844 [Trebouxia sp. C0010 RCD-2024]
MAKRHHPKQQIISLGVTTNLGTTLFHTASNSTSVRELRTQVAQQHTIAHEQNGQVTCVTIEVGVSGLTGRYTLPDNYLLSSVAESQQGSSSFGVFAELRQVSSKAASPDREQVERRPAEQTAQDALQPDAPAAAEDLPAPTTQQQSMPVADQPPAKDKKEKKKAKAATDELQGASEFAAAQNSKMGKKRKKHSEHTAAATEDLQGTAGTSAALEHLPQAGSATQADALADRPAAASKPGTAAAGVSSGAQPVEPVTSAVPPADADMRATAGAHDSSADLAAQPARKKRKKSTPAQSGAEKKQTNKRSSSRAAGQNEAAPGGTAAEHEMGPPSAADGPPHEAQPTPAAQQPKSLSPAEPMDSEPSEPVAEIAALASLGAATGPAAATDAEADASLADTGAAKKKKKKRKGSDRAAATLQAEVAEDLRGEDPQSSAMPVKKSKKKKKVNKAKPSNSAASHDAAPAPDDEGLVEPQAHELKQGVSADPVSGQDVTAGAGPSDGGGPSADAAATDGQERLPTNGKGRTGNHGDNDAAAAQGDKSKAQKSKKAAKAAEKAAAKGKAEDPHASKGTPALKQSLPASPAKSQQGQWKTKPTASKLVSGSGTSKEANPKAGVDALALMPHIPLAPGPATGEGAAEPASASQGSGAHPAPASDHHNSAQGDPGCSRR